MSSDPPTYTKAGNETLEMTVGDNMTLNCNAKGNPPPSYRWEFPKFTKEWHDKEEVIEPILTLPFELPGVYTCTAYSKQGNVTKYFNISEAPSKFSLVTSWHFVSRYTFLLSIIFCAVILH